MTKRICKMEGCERFCHGQGLCGMHYQRLITFGDPLHTTNGYAGVASLHPYDLSTEERFWIKVNKDGPVPPHRLDLGPCWLWTAACDVSGYGRFGMVKANGRWGMRPAHQVAYELAGGTIPPGLFGLHHCDVPRCVNAVNGHIWIGTKGQNNADRHAKGRDGVQPGSLKTHCVNGHPLSGDNVHVTSEGYRRCRQCRRERMQRVRDAKREINR